jgi:outer membrane protein assembly factor BamB
VTERRLSIVRDATVTPPRDPLHFPVAFGSSTLVVGDAQRNTLTGYDNQTGRQLWQTRTGVFPFATTAPSDHLVYIGSPTGLEAIEETTGRTRWVNTTTVGVHGSVVATGAGFVVVSLRGPTIAVLDARNGKLRWQYPGVKVTSHPVVSVAKNTVVVSGDPNTCSD